MRSLLASLLLVALGTSPALAADHRVGQETTISFAGNGGLRNWQAGEPSSNIVYVRDRNERWYQVTLTGPCLQHATYETMVYTTDNAGVFDRFSRVSSPQYPGQVCGVTSIRTSEPPHGQPGAPKRH